MEVLASVVVLSSAAVAITAAWRWAGAPPSRVRSALQRLIRRGLVTNDRFDPLRPGGDAAAEALERAAEPVARAGRTS